MTDCTKAITIQRNRDAMRKLIKNTSTRPVVRMSLEALHVPWPVGGPGRSPEGGGTVGGRHPGGNRDAVAAAAVGTGEKAAIEKLRHWIKLSAVCVIK